MLKGAGAEAELRLLSLRQWLQRRRLHGHDHRGEFRRLQHGHGWRGCGPERDVEGVPMLLRHHAVANASLAGSKMARGTHRPSASAQHSRRARKVPLGGNHPEGRYVISKGSAN